MKVTVDGTSYDVLSESDLDNWEVIAIEEATGLTCDKWKERGGFKLMTALVWITIRRVNPDARYETTRFKITEIDTDDTGDRNGTNGTDRPVGKGPRNSPAAKPSSTSTRRSSRTTSASAPGS